MDPRKQMACFNSGRWFQLPKQFLWIMGAQEAVMLAHLINHACLKFDNGEDEDGWFPHTTKQIQNRLPMPERSQKRALSRLKSAGFIDMERRGVPSKRWICINIKYLKDTLESPLGPNRPQQSDPSHSGQYGPNSRANMAPPSIIGKEPSLKNLSQPTAGTGKRKKGLHPRWACYATKLAKAIKEVRKLDATSKIQPWAREIRKLQTVEKIPVSRIRATLEWYCSTIVKGDLIRSNTNYIPIAYSGGSFRNKFLQIEAAIAREAEEEPSTPDVMLLSGAAMGRLTHLAKLFRQAGVSLPPDARQLAHDLGEWKTPLRKTLLKIREEAEIATDKAEKEALKSDGLVSSDVSQPIREVQAAMERIIPQFGEPYLNWIVDQVTNWDHWEGSLKGFHPGGKHFKRFLEITMKNSGWTWWGDIRSLLVGAEKG